MNVDKLIVIEEKRQQLNEDLAVVIDEFLKESEETEIKIEPIFWGGLESEPLTANYITPTVLVIYYKGMEINRVQWRLLTIDKLLQIAFELEKID
jgi:hypothetical protein